MWILCSWRTSLTIFIERYKDLIIHFSLNLRSNKFRRCLPMSSMMDPKTGMLNMHCLHLENRIFSSHNSEGIWNWDIWESYMTGPTWRLCIRNLHTLQAFDRPGGGPFYFQIERQLEQRIMVTPLSCWLVIASQTGGIFAIFPSKKWCYIIGRRKFNQWKGDSLI